MKLTKPGELRSFAAYPRCSTDTRRVRPWSQVAPRNVRGRLLSCAGAISRLRVTGESVLFARLRMTCSRTRLRIADGEQDGAARRGCDAEQRSLVRFTASNGR